MHSEWWTKFAGSELVLRPKDQITGWGGGEGRTEAYRPRAERRQHEFCLMIALIRIHLPVGSRCDWLN